MPQTTLCRLCVSSGNEYKTLFDDNGQLNRIFKIAVKYFDPILLISGNKHTSNVICLECWHHIEDFYRFQQTVIKSQAQLEFHQPIICLTRLEDELFKRICDVIAKPTTTATTDSTASQREEIDDMSNDTQLAVVPFVETIKNQPTVLNSQEQVEMDDLLAAIFGSDEQTSATSLTVSDIGHVDDTQLDFFAKQPPINSNNSQPTAISVFELVQIQDIPSEANKSKKEKQIEYDAFIAKWKGELKCFVCKRQFSTYTALSRHFTVKHRDTKCYTFCCGRKIMQRSKYVAHIQKCHIAKPIPAKKCKFCSASLTDNSQLRKHILKFHKDMVSKRRGEFECEMCTSTFTREDNLRMHYRFKHEGYPLPEYNCNKCTMTYKNKFSFEKHVRKYHPEELGNEETPDIKKVSHCNIPLKEDLSLNNKQSKLFSTPKNKETYNCNVCEKSFAKKGNMILHNRRVHDERYRNILKASSTNSKRLKLENDALIAKLRGQLECPLCKRLFNTFTLLNYHFQDQHHGKQCHIICCSHKFHLRSRIIKHIHKKHNERTVKSYKCISCTETFYENDQLRKHVVEMHKPKNTKNINGKYKCDICLVTFGNELRLREHYRLKHKEYPLPQYSCSQCNLIFNTQYRMEKHFKNEHIYETTKNVSLQTFEGFTSETEEGDKEKPNIYKLYEKNNYTKNTGNNEKEDSQNYGKSTIDINSKDSASENEEVNKFEKKNQTQLKTQHIIQKNAVDQQENNQIISNSFVPSHIIKEEISIYPSDVESETDRQSEFNTSENEENKDLTYDFFTNSKISKATKQQYDAFIQKWKGDLECPKCPKEMFENFSMLGQHFRIKHNNERPFIQCCSFKLISRYPICAHLCLHLNPNAYQCDVCKRSFKNSWNLRSHKSHVHGKVRWCNCYKLKLPSSEYDMTVCCKRKQKRLDNDAKISKLKKELECWYCKSKFPYYSMLHSHFQFEHRKEKFCIECCGLKFYKVSDITKHYLEHSSEN